MSAIDRSIERAIWASFVLALLSAISSHNWFALCWVLLAAMYRAMWEVSQRDLRQANRELSGLLVAVRRYLNHRSHTP